MTPEIKNKSIASLGLGIVAIVLAWFGWGALVALVCGIVGVVLAAGCMKSLKAAGVKPSGMTIAGLVCSIVGLALSAILFIIVICALSVACSALGAAGMLS